MKSTSFKQNFKMQVNCCCEIGYSDRSKMVEFTTCVWKEIEDNGYTLGKCCERELQPCTAYTRTKS